MRTFVLLLSAVPAVVMAACTSETDGQAALCSEDLLKQDWTLAACCQDLGTDGHIYVYGQGDPAGDFPGLFVRQYSDDVGTPCRTSDGTTDCGCNSSSGASPACEEGVDTQCEFGPSGSTLAGEYGDENAVVFVPKGAQESSLCGADDNGTTAGGTHPDPASSQEYTGRQRSYESVAGTMPNYTKCSDGTPGFVLTLRASCTGDVTGTVSWGTNSVACTSTTGGENLVEMAFWAALDAPVVVEHSPTGWQGWAEACEGTGPCELSIDEDEIVVGQFGG